MPYVLFMGIAFSITAFPVLARIVFERKIQKTRVGYLSLSAAALNDCAAWFLLSAVLAYIKTENLNDALIRVGLIAAYLLSMFFLVKPLLHRFYHKWENNFSVIILITVLISSILTEMLGIHALFGAFITGLIISDMKFNKSELILKLHDVSIIIFLPAFFAISGLRTSIGLINNKDMVYAFGLIMIIAVSGKFLAGTLTSRIFGMSWTDSASIGILLNTRGLVELIILNIGYDLGMIGPTIFTILVLMAVTTTVITGPLLNLVERLKKFS
jgi:Kef-type K+ transport system membrane component KefB